jgi:16S rRNA G527 N7-methylase RsmG
VFVTPRVFFLRCYASRERDKKAYVFVRFQKVGKTFDYILSRAIASLIQTLHFASQPSFHFRRPVGMAA